MSLNVLGTKRAKVTAIKPPNHQKEIKPIETLASGDLVYFIAKFV
jgi:hypothetical protein